VQEGVTTYEWAGPPKILSSFHADSLYSISTSWSPQWQWRLAWVSGCHCSLELEEDDKELVTLPHPQQ
jgi:hypothetical protein